MSQYNSTESGETAPLPIYHIHQMSQHNSTEGGETAPLPIHHIHQMSQHNSIKGGETTPLPIHQMFQHNSTEGGETAPLPIHHIHQMSQHKNNTTKTTNLMAESGQIHWQKKEDKILLILPEGDEFPLTEWSDMLQDLKCRLNAAEKTWIRDTNVQLMAGERLLDARQLQAIAETLSEFELMLTEICTNRRQTAVVAATAGYSVLQNTFNQPILSQTEKNESNFLAPLYLKNSVRSGVEIRHQGTIVVFGDLNPGGSLIAAGDILVWGRLRGMAYAGALGNQQARIMALKMNFTQLRIADKIARSPEQNPVVFDAEVAYISEDGIRLTKALDFVKHYSFSDKIGAWIESPNQLLTKNN